MDISSLEWTKQSIREAHGQKTARSAMKLTPRIECLITRGIQLAQKYGVIAIENASGIVNVNAEIGSWSISK